jgi:predicted nucleotidyltransferase
MNQFIEIPSIVSARIPQHDLPQAVLAFCQRWRVSEFSLFGSILREDFCSDSDVDVLVSFTEDAEWSLFDVVKMKEELENMFGRKVDLVQKQGLRNPFRRHNILRSYRVIYAV